MYKGLKRPFFIFCIFSTGKDTYKVFKMNMREQSQLYEVEVPALDINNSYYVDLEKMPYGKFLPFNYLAITNNSAQKIRLVVNDSVRKLIMPGTILTFDSATLPAIWSIKVVNKGTAAINDGEVLIAFQKVSNIYTRSFKILGWDI